MKKISLTNTAYLLYYPCFYMDTANSILIIPNSAGYFAQNPKRWDGIAKEHLNIFCNDLAQRYRVYYLVLPGQDPEADSLYSYTGSVAATKEAIQYVSQHRKLKGVIGMCTGGAIAAQALHDLGLNDTHLIIYNTAASVGWHIPKIQDKFDEKYGRKCGGPVKLDHSELTRNAPHQLASIIKKHAGRILQLACHKSDYEIENQRKLQKQVPKIFKIEFSGMSDVPNENDASYKSLMLKSIFEFLM